MDLFNYTIIAKGGNNDISIKWRLLNIDLIADSEYFLSHSKNILLFKFTNNLECYKRHVMIRLFNSIILNCLVLKERSTFFAPIAVYDQSQYMLIIMRNSDQLTVRYGHIDPGNVGGYIDLFTLENKGVEKSKFDWISDSSNLTIVEFTTLIKAIVDKMEREIFDIQTNT